MHYVVYVVCACIVLKRTGNSPLPISCSQNSKTFEGTVSCHLIRGKSRRGVGRAGFTNRLGRLKPIGPRRNKGPRHEQQRPSFYQDHFLEIDHYDQGCIGNFFPAGTQAQDVYVQVL